jgi:hypothetical protein
MSCGRRLHAAAEAVTVGHGGVTAASRATKVARSTIGRGIKDLKEPGSLTGKVRRKGAGRPPATTVHRRYHGKVLTTYHGPAPSGAPHHRLRSEYQSGHHPRNIRIATIGGSSREWIPPPFPDPSSRGRTAPWHNQIATVGDDPATSRALNRRNAPMSGIPASVGAALR